MTPIEIMALIVVLAAAIKILVILVNPKSWLGIVNKVWSKPVLTGLISLILAGVVLYYLIQELTIVQIFAVILFIALISATSMAVYAKDFIAMAQKFAKDRSFLKKAWLAVLIWIILILWALKELLM